MPSDPRFASVELLTLAALRLRERVRQPAPAVWPDPGEAWWQEFWHIVRTSPHGAAVLAHLTPTLEEGGV